MPLEEYKQAVIASAAILVIGLVLVYFSNSVYVPSTHSTFLGIPYATTDEYASNLYTKVAILFVGVLIIGVGLGCAISIYPFYDLEKHKVINRQLEKPYDI